MPVEMQEDALAVGRQGAALVVGELRRAIGETGQAALVAASGACRLAGTEHLCVVSLPWRHGTVLRLDEDVGLPADHPARVRQYLRERLTENSLPRRAISIEAEGDVTQTLQQLAHLAGDLQVGVALMGVGENAHIDFDDPPPDLNTSKPCCVLRLTLSGDRAT